MGSKNQTAKRAGKFVVIGIVLTAFNFLVYTLLARIIFNNNELLWLDSMISYILATFLAYILHSKITWKERDPGKTGLIKFFAWSLVVAIIISPFLTWLFGLITPIYQFAFNISTSIGLPFDYTFIESTGIFCFTTVITLVLNYLFYDKLVFGNLKDSKAINS